MAPSKPLAPCGTRAAYGRHYDRGERACDDCREAFSDERIALRRATKRLAELPELADEYAVLVEEQKGKPGPRELARRELVRRHPTRFRQLHEEELALVGRGRCDCGAELVQGSCWACPAESAPAGRVVPGERWRPGRRRGRTLYIHRDGEEDGELIGMVDTPELAAAICAAMNARGTERRGDGPLPPPHQED